jgi:hypothetical protein
MHFQRNIAIMGGTITRGKETGTWLTILPTFVNGTELSSHEWRDTFLLRYSLFPLGLPLKCDGCGDKYGGLVVLRQMGAKPYSVVKGFVNARINLSEVPEFQHPKGARESNWHDGAGLGIFETM